MTTDHNEAMQTIILTTGTSRTMDGQIYGKHNDWQTPLSVFGALFQDASCM